jgi:hypothetical protein
MTRGVVLNIKVPRQSGMHLKVKMSMNHDMRPFSLLLNDSFTRLLAECNNKHTS